MDLKPLNLPSGNGTTAASALSVEAAVSSSRLHNSKPPTREIQSEQPWHYAVAMMVASGAVTQKEVCEAFGRTPATISILFRQQWFQERVTKLMGERGRDIMDLFQKESFNSMITLVELRDSGKSETVRRTAAVDILDRGLGKPLQRVEQTGPRTSDDPVAEMERLQQDNERRRSALSPSQ